MQTAIQDKIIIGISLGLLVVFGVLIYTEFTTDAEISKTSLVGEVSFRYRVAQRRSRSNVIWSDVAQNEPLYDLDSVRTDDESEAIIRIQNGPVIELDPNSMVVIHVKDSAKSIEIKRGSVLIKDQASSGFTYRFGKNEVSNIDTFVQYFQKENGDQFFSGNGFDLRDQQGDRQIGAHKLLEAIDGNLTQNSTGLVVQAPLPNARHFIHEKTAQIVFKWQGSIASRLIIAKDYGLEQKILDKIITNNHTQSFSEGIYYFQLQNENQVSAIQKFRIIRMEGLVLLTPVKESFNQGDVIGFSWKKSELAGSYHFQTASDSQFSHILIDTHTKKNSISISPDVGNHYWRLRAISYQGKVHSKWLSGRLLVEKKPTPVLLEDKKIQTDPVGDLVENSKTQNQITKNTAKKENNTPTVAKPQAIYPYSGASIDMANKNSILFKWKGCRKSCKISLYNLNKQKVIVFSKVVDTDSYSFTDLSRLDVGKFYWEISGQQSTANNKKAGHVFYIRLSQELDRPELEL